MSERTKKIIIAVCVFILLIPVGFIVFINIVFYSGTSHDTIKTVLGMRNPRLEITSAAFNRRDMDFMQQFTKNSPTASARSWSGIVFARLWIPLYLKGIDRCIYLDTDTLVRKPLRELWNVDLQGKAYGMAMGSVPEYGYNSGVMLMDLRKVDVAHNWKSLCEHMRKYAATYMLPDQTVINRYYAGQIFELPKKFNYGGYYENLKRHKTR